MISSIKSILDAKELFRLKMAGERTAAAKARPDAAQHAARVFLDSIPLLTGSIISLYHPIKDELDTKPLADELIERGFEICLPVVVKKKSPLTFRQFQRGDALEEGAYGVMTPSPEAAELIPDIIATPLLAFDRSGGRLGYGGGFYDRTLEQARADRDILVVGYAFGAQEVDAVPVSRLDQRLDWIVTERAAIRART